MSAQGSRSIFLAAGLAVLGCSPAPGQGDGNKVEVAPVTASARDRAADGFPAEPEMVTDPSATTSIIAAFDEHMRGFGQRVRSCDQVVRIQIGKDSIVYGRGLAAYGAYCRLANGQDVALCYEEALGRFAMVARSFYIERAWIEAFTLRTCADPS